MKQVFLIMPNESEPKPPHILFQTLLTLVGRGKDIAAFKINERFMFIVNSDRERDEFEFFIDCKTCRLGEVDHIDGRILDMARHVAQYVVSGGEYVV